MYRATKRWIPAALLLLLSIYAAPASAQDGLVGPWWDATDEKLTQLHGLQTKLGRRISQLEDQLSKAKKDVESKPDCRDLDCRELKNLSDIIAEVRGAVKGAWLLSRVSEVQRQNYAETFRGSIRFMRRNVADLRAGLFAQEIAQMVAEIAADAAIAAATGKPPARAAELLHNQIVAISGTIVNYSLNKSIDLAVGHKSTTTSAVASATGYDRNRMTNSATKALVGRLMNVNVIEVKDGVARWKVGPGYKNTVSNAASVVTRTLINALTDGAIEDMKADLAQSVKALEKVIAMERDAIMVVEIQKITSEKIRDLRGQYNDLLDRLEKVQGTCRLEAAQKRCDENLEKAKDQAEQRRKEALGDAFVQRDTARKALADKRAEWQAAFDEAAHAHEALRKARDDLAEAEQISNNLSRIELLAKSARDAEVRDKYQRELKKLEQLGNLSALKSEAEKQEKRRADAWRKVEQLEQEIGRQSQSMLATVQQADTRIEQAEAAHHAALNAALDAYYQCLDAARPDMSQVLGPTTAEMRKRYPGELFPYEIFDTLEKKLMSLNEKLQGRNVSYSTRPECRNEQAVAPVGDLTGCWRASGDEIWHLRQTNSTVQAQLYEADGGANVAQGAPVARGQGSFIGNEFDVELDNPTPDTRNGIKGSLVFDRFDLPVGLKAKTWTKIKSPPPLADIYNEFKLSVFRIRPEFVTSVTIKNEDFSKTLRAHKPGENLNIEVQAQDPCPFTVDHLPVQVFPQGASDEMRVVMLTETGPDTGVYRTPDGGLAINVISDKWSRFHFENYLQSDPQFLAIDLTFDTPSDQVSQFKIPLEGIDLPEKTAFPRHQVPDGTYDPANSLGTYLDETYKKVLHEAYE